MAELLLAYEPAIRLSAFVSIFAAMAFWEVLAPRRRQAIGRFRRWPGNIGVVALNTLLLRLAFPVAAVGVASVAEARGWGLFQAMDAPVWVAVVSGIILLDLAIYLQHVMFHAVPVLWRLHRMHHADLEFDVTTGSRFHPIEILLSMAIKLGVVAALGTPAVAVLIFEVLLNATSMFNHGNVRLPQRLDAALRLAVVTPDMHRVHHSVVPREANSNFGFNLPLWDRLFGTYRAQPQAGHEAMTIGIEQFRDPGELRLDRMLFQPLRGDDRLYPLGRREIVATANAESRKAIPDSRGTTPPILADKQYDTPSAFTPESLLREARRQRELANGTVPAICLLDPDGDLVRRLKKENRATRDPSWACYHTGLYRFTEAGIEFGIVGCAVGASFAVLIAEELFASGCRLLIGMTSAGQLVPVRPPPYFILIERALRDEGTSYHYLAPAAFSTAGSAMLNAMQGAFDGLRVPVLQGATWTTDAPFRETAETIAAMQEKGLLAVEMEAAALYAFAEARGRPVLCFAHVTNQMGRIEGDFEKGEADGTVDALAVIAAAAKRVAERGGDAWPG